MRIKVSVLAALSGLSLATVSMPAMAGGCGIGTPANCNVGVNVIPSAPASFGPMTVHNDHPMGHLTTVDFQRAPNVSIMRVHGMGPTAALADAPSGFTGGCHPSSTNYCRANAGAPVSVQMNAPLASTQFVSAPVVSAPIMTAPAQPLRTWTGQGYDPAKFQPRQYGDNTFTPGIAHIPTSIVDRSPVNAQAILNSGRTVAQPIVSASSFSSSSRVTLPGKMSPSLSYSAQPSVQPSLVTFPGTMSPIMAQGMSSSAAQPSAPVAVGNGTFASNVAPDGTYWEKTSGMTMMGDTVATQIICKRQLPRQVVNPVVNVPVPVPTRVVNPVVRVPVAVPTPVPVSVPVCNRAPAFNNRMLVPTPRPYAQPIARYNGATGSRWTY